ncbi:MAG: zinc-dependent peptidase [Gammaproteobacteria bacterium]|nr:zinc-dependent peptidase [Gammaproteobacteria bacterium]
MFRFMKPYRPAVTDEVWGTLRESLPIVATLREPDAEKLRGLTDSFLRTKSLEGAGGFELEEETRVVVAAQACVPILELGMDAYTGWRSVVVYPGGFVSRGTSVDETGVEHEWEEPRSGESWFQGPVVLSWEDVAASGRLEGYNVVIHEMAHKLDMLNGDANGFPPLHAEMDGATWYQVFSEAFEDLCVRVDAGEETAIDDYATEGPDEFFAVTSEYFFELPEVLDECYPKVYAELRAFYRQDPMERIAAAYGR